MRSNFFLFIITALASLISSTPIPIKAATSSDWRTNVILLAGASQLALWAPTDGALHLVSSITCFDISASAYGSCGSLAIDHLAVVEGYTCYFVGNNGFAGSQVGTNSSGFWTVGPPQSLAWVSCWATKSD